MHNSMRFSHKLSDFIHNRNKSMQIRLAKKLRKWRSLVSAKNQIRL